MQLLQSLWGDEAGNKAIVAIRRKKVYHHWVNDAVEAVALAARLNAKKWDVYFSCSTFTEQRRLQDYAASIRAFWLDLDCGEGKPYRDLAHAIENLLDWCIKRSFPAPSSIVSSGHGVHVYWFLSEPVTHAQWLPVAQAFKRALGVDQVQADPTRTADAASILRVPGTLNWKDPKNPQPVEELYSGDCLYSLAEFFAKIPQHAVQPALSAVPKGDTGVLQGLYPPGDAEAIADACAQMGQIRASRGAVSEPFWRAGLSVLQRCAGAETLIHEWSTGDERYDPTETARKAKATKGPATCKHFSEINPGGCMGCSFAEKVTSPIQIRVAALPPPAAENAWQANKVGRFIVSSAGVFYNAPVTEEDPEPQVVQCTTFPLWVREVRQKARMAYERDHASLFLEYVDLTGATRQGAMFQAELYDVRTLRAWLADHSLMPGVRDLKLLTAYVSTLTERIARSTGISEYHEALGWHDDGFVVGNRIIYADRVAAVPVQSGGPLSQLSAKGDVQAWVRGIAALNAPEFDFHAFAVLCGFASPLLYPADVQSAVVSLAGVSGAGKTLAARAALSIYGDPKLLMQSATSTWNAIGLQMGRSRHVPFLLDETTAQPPEKIANFIYDASNGSPKATATRTREIREALNWKLVPFITSNKPWLEVSDDKIQEAHRRRLVELYFPAALPRNVGDAVNSAIEGNYGVVVVPYMEAIQSILPEISNAVAIASKEIATKHHVPNANRFGLWTIATAKVAGEIAAALGLIPFNIDRIIESVVAALVADTNDFLTEEARAEKITTEWLVTHSKRISVWHEGSNALQVDDPIARVVSVTHVALHANAVTDLWSERHISKAQGIKWLGHDHKKVKLTLAPGLPQVWCYLIPKTKVGMIPE